MMTRLIRLARVYTRLSSPVAFVARKFITDAGRAHARRQPLCLDIGAGTAPYRAEILAAFHAESYITLDVAPSDQTTLVADARALPLRSQSVDMVVSFDVVQHIVEPEALMSEVGRVLRPEGYAIFTFPFLYAECDFLDYQRWTMQGMHELLMRHGLDPILSRRRGGTFFAVACMLNWFMQHLIPGQRASWREARTWRAVARSAAVVLLTIPTNVVGWIALAVDSVLPAHGAYMGGAILAQRRKDARAELPETNVSAS